MTKKKMEKEIIRYFAIDCTFSSPGSGERPMEMDIGNYLTRDEAREAGRRIRTKELTEKELVEFRNGLLPLPGGFAVESKVVQMDKRIRNGARLLGSVVRFGWTYPLYHLRPFYGWTRK